MKKEVISFKHKGAVQNFTLVSPESLVEIRNLFANGVISEGCLVRAVRNELFTEAKNALIGRKKRIRLARIELDPDSDIYRKVQELLRVSKSLSVKESEGAEASMESVSKNASTFAGDTTEAHPEASEILPSVYS
jgi:hypothetical protein